jgi:hypothetical protein
MTEQEWLTCQDPYDMLKRLRRRKKLDRKFYLFACACWRRAIRFMIAKHAIPTTKFAAPESSEVLLAAIATLESYADGLIKPKQLEPFFRAWYYMTLGIAYHGGERLKAEDASPWQVALWGSSCSGKWAFNYSNGTPAQQQADERLEGNAQADLLRHIFGNLYRPYPEATSSWPSVVVQLAEAIYAGEDCSFALRDALLEAGHPELAEHFKDKDHPRGCWAIDLILART